MENNNIKNDNKPLLSIYHYSLVIIVYYVLSGYNLL